MDPIINLAFALHANRGAYALLVGSGVSRAAGIPTGWEVVSDLIRKIAITCGDECDPNPEAWYLAKYGKEPAYNDILEKLGLTAVERSSILREYFEPSPQDEHEGLKRPTSAHKAIAQLVKAGYVRVIITTNFDRLIESALEAAGVQPTVISTPDAAEGARPLAHSDCTLMKIHGDYLDTRIKNTVSELSEYDTRMNTLIDRVLDEYGLIVCGWSGDWDPALRSAIERTKSNRYSTFWAALSEPSQHAQKMICLRRASVVQTKGAESFFAELAEKVTAIEDTGRSHPVSAQVAVATLKRCLVDDSQRIRLHDLLSGEVERVVQRLSSDEFSVKERWDADLFRKRVSRYEGELEVLLSLIAAGSYWGEPHQAGLWTRCMERITVLYLVQTADTRWLNLCLYPALLLLYAGGISAMAAGRYDNVRALLLDPQLIDKNEETLLLQVCFASNVFRDTGKYLPGKDKMRVPGSEHLYAALRPVLVPIIPGEQDYTKAFDDFEYFIALLYASRFYVDADQVWGPLGCFAWRNRYISHTAMTRFSKHIAADATKGQELVRSGLFDSVESAIEMAARFNKDMLDKLNHWF